MLRSTFTRLMFLGAHYTPHFELVDDRTSPGAERVRVWKVWYGTPRASATRQPRSMTAS